MSKERCNVCDELTGHAGSGEDSVFIDTPNGEIGPLCPECLDAIRAFVDDDTGASKALADAKAEIERLTYALKVCRAVLILQQLSDSANGKPEAAESCQPFIDLIDETLDGPSSC